MNYAKFVLTIFLAFGVLVGCNDKEPKVEVSSQQAEQEEQTKQEEQAEQTERIAQSKKVTDETAVQTTYHFIEFSLDVEYDNDVSYELEYERENNVVSAEIDDEVNQVFVEGNEAFTMMKDQLESLTFKEDSTKEEVLEQVMEVFNIDENYRSIEVEVTFNNGEKKEYNFRK